MAPCMTERRITVKVFIRRYTTYTLLSVIIAAVMAMRKRCFVACRVLPNGHNFRPRSAGDTQSESLLMAASAHWISPALVLCALVMMGQAVSSHAADDKPTGKVTLYLADGVSPRAEGQREGRDVELELTLRDGVWQKEVWGYAVWFVRADHHGEVVRIEQSGDTVTLDINLTVNGDKWVKGGQAKYQLTLKRDGDAFVGSHTGKFMENDVAGKVHGRIYPDWTQPSAGFKALEPNERPRLMFRKSDLPEIRRRMETPEGKAIMARFRVVLDRNITNRQNPKNSTFFPAGYALAYQLTGDKAYADKAKAEMEPMLRLGGRQDIHYGPLALGIALTLDMCYDAWDPAFRQTVIDNLASRLRDLYTGQRIGTFAPNPWHNHNGVRAPSAGVAAICLLGEKTSDGKEIQDLDKWIHVLARDNRRYFTMGLGETGWCLEGAFYKRMTWNSGPGHFIHAYRTALGGNMIEGWPGGYTILGEWMQSAPENRVPRFDIGNHESSGLFPVGLVTVPADLRAGARWLYDRTFGLEGDKSFGIQWAMHAGYVLMNYPFEVAAKPPGESLPWAAPDVRKGHYLFRKPWQDARDTLVVLHLRSEIMSGCHYERSGQTLDMQLWALGRQWIGDASLTEKTGRGAALPAIGGHFNGFMGARTRSYHADDEGLAVLSLDLSDVYLQALPKGTQPPADAKLALIPRVPGGGRMIDHGILAHREMAIDLSGRCGAPVLLAIVDRVDAKDEVLWLLKLARGAGEVKIDGSRFTVGNVNDAHMAGAFIAPGEVKLAPGLRAQGGSNFFVVLTIQKGPAPEIKVEGSGLDARVTVGSRTLRFDGERLVVH
jgi:hypothetical protein